MQKCKKVNHILQLSAKSTYGTSEGRCEKNYNCNRATHIYMVQLLPQLYQMKQMKNKEKNLAIIAAAAFMALGLAIGTIIRKL